MMCHNRGSFLFCSRSQCPSIVYLALNGRETCLGSRFCFPIKFSLNLTSYRIIKVNNDCNEDADVADKPLARAASLLLTLYFLHELAVRHFFRSHARHYHLPGPNSGPITGDCLAFPAALGVMAMPPLGTNHFFGLWVDR